MNNLEEGTTLQLDYSKLEKAVAAAPGILPVAVQNADTREVILLAYVNEQALRHAIETLKKAIAADPKSDQVPKQRFFIAQCHEKLGQVAEARTYYQQVDRAHPDTPWAEKARERLAEIAAAE